MVNTYEAERKSAKADIEAGGCSGHILNRTTSAKTPCSFLILSFSMMERMSGLVQEADAKFMTPALGIPDIDPEIHDAVIDTTNPLFAASVGTYQIVAPNPFAPGGVPIWYDIQARRR